MYLTERVHRGRILVYLLLLLVVVPPEPACQWLREAASMYSMYNMIVWSRLFLFLISHYNTRVRCCSGFYRQRLPLLLLVDDDSNAQQSISITLTRRRVGKDNERLFVASVMVERLLYSIRPRMTYILYVTHMIHGWAKRRKCAASGVTTKLDHK